MLLIVKRCYNYIGGMKPPFPHMSYKYNHPVDSYGTFGWYIGQNDLSRKYRDTKVVDCGRMMEGHETFSTSKTYLVYIE